MGSSFLGPARCINRANSSLPVPLSPKSRVVDLELATLIASEMTLRSALLSPTNSFLPRSSFFRSLISFLSCSIFRALPMARAARSAKTDNIFKSSSRIELPSDLSIISTTPMVSPFIFIGTQAMDWVLNPMDSLISLYQRGSLATSGIKSGSPDWAT